MDRPICRDYIIGQDKDFIIRLNTRTKLIYKGDELSVNTISKKVLLFMELSATKIQKSKKKMLTYECGAIKVKYRIKGELYDLWLVVTKRKDGGYYWLLTRSSKRPTVDIISEAFKAYGFRWKIEEYHRHIKSCYA